MTVKIKLDPGANAKMPTRAHRWDAGLDLYAKEGTILHRYRHETLGTGLHILIPPGFVGFVKPRSGLMSKHGILTDGTIDPGYTGEIMVTLFNCGDVPVQIRAGDRIAQLVILPVAFCDTELVDDLEETERGANGFGSTGR